MLFNTIRFIYSVAILGKAQIILSLIFMLFVYNKLYDLLDFFWFNCRYVLESQHMKKFFDYIQLPHFDIAADAATTFKVKFNQQS